MNRYLKLISSARSYLLLSMLVFAVVAGTISLSYGDEPTVAKEIWLSPLDNLIHPKAFPAGASDYMSLFEKNANWPEKIPEIKVFKIYPYFAGHASDADLIKIIGFLKEHHLKLALEAGVLTSPENCGSGVEGYGGQYLPNLAGRIQHLGGQLDYLAMDEPLWFGHFSQAESACHSDIKVLAENAAATIRLLRAKAPDIRIGDIEPAFGGPQTASYISDIKDWLQEFQTANGGALSFVQLDVNWFRPWIASVAALGSVFNGADIPYGLIYNGTASDSTDSTWIEHAKQHFLEFEKLHSAPDQAIFQTWTSNPTNVLPVQSGTTLTGLVREYVKAPSRFISSRSDNRLTWTLINQEGAHLAGESLTAERRPRSAPSDLQTQVITGSVPPLARTAVFAVRINTECGCAGSAQYNFAGAIFQQSGGPVQIRNFANGTSDWSIEGNAEIEIGQKGEGVRLLHIKATPEQLVQLNSTAFPVGESRPFSAQFSSAFADGSEAVSLFALIFLDGNRKEIKRVLMRPEWRWTPDGKIQTDSAGNFSPTAPPPDWIERIIFSGDAVTRPTSLTLNGDD